MAKDILLGGDDDLLFEEGDLVVDESSEQEVGLIIRTNQGEWRASPLTGFGVGRRTREEVNRTLFARDLQGQLELDGFADAQVELTTEGKLDIKARRHD